MIDEDTALKAHKLSVAGHSNRQVKEALELTSTAYATVLVGVGGQLQEILNNTLTPDELRIIRALARLKHKNLLQHGSVSSSKSKHVSWAVRGTGRHRLGYADGWAAQKVKRLLVPLGLVEHKLNGHMWLTPAGWALANALPPEEDP